MCNYYSYVFKIYTIFAYKKTTILTVRLLL